MSRTDSIGKLGIILSFIGYCFAPSAAEAYQCGWVFAPQVQYDTGTNATGVDTADFNGDGLLDIIVSNRVTNDVVVLVNDGTGQFTLLSTVFVGGTPRYVVAGDLDGDGDIDAVTPNWDGDTVSILINDGTGVLTVLDEYTFYRPTCIALADLDGDGDLDFAVSNLRGDSITIAANLGKGGFVVATTLLVGPRPR